MAMSYEEVARRLGRQAVVRLDRRRGTEFRIAPTHLQLHGDIDDADASPDLQVRYHGTPVVTLHADHTYTLRTGGLATKTLLRRISEYAPVSLITRGGSVYIQDPRTGDIVQPFTEGMRVDRHGREVIDAPPAPKGGADATPVEGRAADLAAIVAKMLDERLAELGVRPRTPPVRAVRLSTIAAPRPAKKPDPDAPDMVTVMEQSMRAAGIKEDLITRATRGMRQALTRGRTGTVDHTPLPPKKKRPQEPATVRVMRCPDCKLDLATHYDGANRYRGCTWAAKKSSQE